MTSNSVNKTLNCLSPTNMKKTHWFCGFPWVPLLKLADYRCFQTDLMDYQSFGF